MDKIDALLLEAWNRVGARCRRDRVEALKRSQRRFKGVLTRPMRECCLVIRASDTRLSDPLVVDVDAVEAAQHRPHAIVLNGSAIRAITKPVHIPYPGVTYEEAAKLLGRTYESLQQWAREGVFQVERFAEHGFPEGGRKPGRRKKGAPPEVYVDPGEGLDEQSAAWARRWTGWRRPYLWSPMPLDPNNFEGRAPHPVWGTLWQWQWEKMPARFVQVVERVPRWRTHSGRKQFFGWEFVCPGRMNRNGEYAGCGKRCTYLYGPQRVWTLAKAIGLEEGFEVGPPPEAEKVEGAGPSAGATRGVARAAPGVRLSLCPGLEGVGDRKKLEVVGEWFPGLADTVAQPGAGPGAGAGARSFACKSCWGVRSACMANDAGWNEFITHISGGLLCGRDVKRPVDICPVERKKRVYRRRARKRIDDAAAKATVMEQIASA